MSKRVIKFVHKHSELVRTWMVMISACIQVLVLIIQIALAIHLGVLL